MRIHYYADHGEHDPMSLHGQSSHGRNRYYGEVASRGTAILEAIEEAALGPIVPPTDLGLAPIAEIHGYGMLAFLQSAYQNLGASSAQGAADHWLAGRPTTFAVARGDSPHVPNSVFGRFGYYCFDLGSPIFEGTWRAAYWAAQVALSAAADVASDREKIAYALCRPPGHHAAADYFGGFCYLNNAAIAAHWLVQQGQRVAILDLDYHHGNGTQSIFYHRSDVLFCSIHADPLSEYPYYWGYADEYGEGPGQNYNFNYPLPIGAGRPQYVNALESALEKIELFVPTSLVVSFGSDTAEGDPLGGFRLDRESFAEIAGRIRRLDLPTLAIQEGGYRLDRLAGDVIAFLSALAD